VLALVCLPSRTDSLDLRQDCRPCSRSRDSAVRQLRCLATAAARLRTCFSWPSRSVQRPGRATAKVTEALVCRGLRPGRPPTRRAAAAGRDQSTSLLVRCGLVRSQDPDSERCKPAKPASTSTTLPADQDLAGQYYEICIYSRWSFSGLPVLHGERERPRTGFPPIALSRGGLRRDQRPMLRSGAPAGAQPPPRSAPPGRGARRLAPGLRSRHPLATTYQK
jgi:hypothetical protein